jgi:hypothetical protein
MTQAVIQKLRALQGLGVITAAHCIRAECYVRRHPEMFDAVDTTVIQATSLAIDCVALPDEFASLARAITGWH